MEEMSAEEINRAIELEFFNSIKTNKLSSINTILEERPETTSAIDDEGNNFLHLLLSVENPDNREELFDALLFIAYDSHFWLRKNNESKIPLDYFDKQKHSAYEERIKRLFLKTHYINERKFTLNTCMSHETKENWSLHPLEILQSMVKLGLNPNKFKDEAKNNGLHLLCKTKLVGHYPNDAATIEYCKEVFNNIISLTEKKDWYKLNHDNKTPIDYFEPLKEHYKIAPALTHNYFIKNKIKTLMHKAIDQNEPYELRRLLSLGVDPLENKSEHQTCLHTLFLTEKIKTDEEKKDHLKIAKLLLPFAGNGWLRENNLGRLPLDYFNPKDTHKHLAPLVLSLVCNFGHFTFKLTNYSYTKEQQLELIKKYFRSTSTHYQTVIKPRELTRLDNRTIKKK